MRPVLLPTDQTLRRFNIFALAIDDACGMKTVGNRLHVNVFLFLFFFCVLAPVIIQAISAVVVGLLLFALPSCTLVKVKSESDK